ncbi:MAG: RES domain-containing protein [Lysobacteraceae bacterium]|nr:MAG: RES domain-containing protein [Xanthomonadaceae bacterium]
MSSITWTPTALAASAAPWAGEAWRMVEAQHAAATMKLVDTAGEQALLERLVEQAKPPLPEAARPLHYLLATPFRYPPLPRGSRFRAAGEPGVFYGADQLPTACAELGYWRWRFLRDAPSLQRIDAVAHTAFRVALKATAVVDLRAPPLSRDRKRWTERDSYTDTQELARRARDVGIAAIRYESVRDPAHGGCTALLTPAGFASKSPKGAPQTWWLTVRQDRATWLRGAQRHEFRFG